MPYFQQRFRSNRNTIRLEMKQYTKRVIWDGVGVDIEVTLDTKVEKRMSGQRWSRVEVDYRGKEGNLFKSEEVRNEWLEETIGSLEYEIMEFLRGKPNLTYDETILASLGFTKK